MGHRSPAAGGPRRARPTEKFTDLGNAKRIVNRHSGELRYVAKWSSWLRWDGRSWTRDEVGSVMELAKQTVRAMYSEAFSLGDDAAEQLTRHARRSEAAGRLRAMVELARTDGGVAATPDDFDRDPWLLNCANGTVDLHTGALRSHRRADLITRLSKVEYIPGRTAPEWDRFLNHVTGCDPAYREFLQRLAGYTLAGEATEERVPFLLGPEASGKTTFLEAMKLAMGDYAATAEFETFLRCGDARGPRDDVARLKGVRLVTASEVPPGRQLDDALVKQLSGGDVVTARELYGKYFEFRPQFTLWLAGNHRPHVRDDDTAIWRRLLVLPFDHTVPEEQRDKRLKQRLQDPMDLAPAVLTWAVEGCLKWQREGLVVPTVVRAATDAYRSEMAHFTLFLEDRCVEAPDQFASSQELTALYHEWSLGQGHRFPLGPRRIAEVLRSRGHTQAKRGGVRGWLGLGIGCPDTLDA
jgi:putative DNA primase/helicase